MASGSSSSDNLKALEVNPNPVTQGVPRKDEELLDQMKPLNMTKEDIDENHDRIMSAAAQIAPDTNSSNINEDEKLQDGVKNLNLSERNECQEMSKTCTDEEMSQNSNVLTTMNGTVSYGTKPVNVAVENTSQCHEKQVAATDELESDNYQEGKPKGEEADEKKQAEPIFDGTESPELEAAETISTRSQNPTELSAWPEKAVALKDFVKERGAVAVSSVFRRLSGKTVEDGGLPESKDRDDILTGNAIEKSDSKETSQQTAERSWNPLSYIRLMLDSESQNKTEQKKLAYEQELTQEPEMKGRVVLYTRLGCQECKEMRSLLRWRQIKYIEINIDIYPSRKLELEKTTGSSGVPKLYLNGLFVGGLRELKTMDGSGQLSEKLKDLVNEEPPSGSPLPPLSGEDDLSGTGVVDELAMIVRKMREHVIVKDRFYKMLRFSDCFVGSEATDFLSEDQYLEREEAVELGRKLAQQLFFYHVLDENLFEDGNQVYRFLDHDPIVKIQCYNIPRGIVDVKPKPVTEIASRLRFLMFAIFEAYVTEDGRHVDYPSIHASEEFARYLRIVEELQRVDLQGLPREEKLAFFINLYNMMVIHAIHALGHPVGPLSYRKMFGEFQYVVGGMTYSLSAIHNGILRGNQRPPYTLIKPFGQRDKRAKVALPLPERLVHFALVSGNRSDPALWCYSPANIDKELTAAAQNFLINGGVVVDTKAEVVSASKILKWYSVDFGKNERDVLKLAANYLEPPKSEEFLKLLSNSQLKVVYQPYDWSLNY